VIVGDTAGFFRLQAFSTQKKKRKKTMVSGTGVDCLLTPGTPGSRKYSGFIG